MQSRPLDTRRNSAILLLSEMKIPSYIPISQLGERKRLRLFRPSLYGAPGPAQPNNPAKTKPIPTIATPQTGVRIHGMPKP